MPTPTTPKAAEQHEQVWVSLAFDPLAGSLLVLGMAESEAESKSQHFRAGDAPYRKSLVIEDGMGPELYQWLIRCGLAHSDALSLVHKYAESLREMLDDVAIKKGWKEPTP